ncbi:MAG TPA: SurA N-terminal domain-containing protein [Labilithrix sp.]|nr:SurA N-terminal domain-containing protein [Labilithrix sp.]
MKPSRVSVSVQYPVRSVAHTRKGPRSLLGALTVVFGLASGVLASSPAQAAIVERVVAVVGERPILLSELRHRARPHLYRIAASTPNASQQAAAESEMLRELLTRLIDERLEEQAADKAHLSVSQEEIDNGIRQVAAQARLDPKQLIAEAKRQGLSEQDYRDEIRRQVLEGKLIQLRVRGRVRVTEQDARAAYNNYVKDLAQQSSVDLRILVLSIPPGSSEQTANARVTLAEELSRRGKAGEDFCELVLQYSDDPSTKSTCGSRGPVPLQALFPELQQIAKTQGPGETSAPLVFKDPTGHQAVLVVQTVAATESKVPEFEQVQEQMMERAYVEATERQRKLWLDELRRGAYVDVRL